MLKIKSNVRIIPYIVLMLGFFFQPAMAQKKKVEFKGFLRDAQGQFVNAKDVSILARTLSPNNCILKEEEFRAVEISEGYFSLALGEGVATSTDKGLSQKQIFDNITPHNSIQCLDAGGNLTSGNYVPAERDSRSLNLIFALDNPDSTEAIDVTFELGLESSGLSTEYFNGKAVDEFLHINNLYGVTQANLESLFSGNDCGSNRFATGIDNRGKLTCAAVPAAGGSGGGSGGLTALTASPPLTSSGGLSPNISIPKASGTQDGFLSATDWQAFNNKLNSVSSSSVTTAFGFAPQPLSPELTAFANSTLGTGILQKSGASSYTTLGVQAPLAISGVNIVLNYGSGLSVNGSNQLVVDAPSTITGTIGSNQITGVLPVANGGTGVNSVSSGNLIIGNGTSAFNSIAPGSSGDVLSVNGTAWASRTPTAAGLVDLASAQTITGTKTFSAASITGATINSLTIPGGNSGSVLTWNAGGSATWGSVPTVNLNFTEIAGTYNVSATDSNKLLNINNSAGATITLPLTANVTAGFRVIIKRTGAASVTITTPNSEKIDGNDGQTYPIVLSDKYMTVAIVNTQKPEAEWLVETKFHPPKLVAAPGNLVGWSTTNGGSCQTITLINTGHLATSTVSISPPSGTITTGCAALNNCNGQTLAAGGSCSFGIKFPDTAQVGAFSGTLTATATVGGSANISVSGTVTDVCANNPPIGTVCSGGGIYAGTFDGGRYMVMPSGCGDFTGSGGSADSPFSDFTPNCNGTPDTLQKKWNLGGFSNPYNIPDVETVIPATQKSSSSYRGNINTAASVTISAVNQGLFHPAARYCDKINYGGYTDWYLPSKSELAYIYCKVKPAGTHYALAPQEDLDCRAYDGKTGLLSGFDQSLTGYWTSTEADNDGYYAWVQNFYDGTQANISFKDADRFLRCVRRF